MAGLLSEDFGATSRDLLLERLTNEQRCQSMDSLAEWRSSEQVENGTPSTSPPYWDTDDDDDGPKPSELYGKFTWKIENFSTINKRELRSNPFEVGGYKWYILIYPQGCDVCNHLSLFLCVANHDKLLPGWSHFAQFTIAVVNKDPKKSKYSDTLHRFWKKEHDWGWKKFMELSKVLDGFIVADTLVIKAQVQVIREKAHRPFRCLDCQYRRELVRVYLSNVEQICRRFVEERRGKLIKLIEDKVRWSSFRAFWLGIDHNARRRMSRDKTDSILKVVVKHFFIEKEVTSTLVMDSLYSGLKALECQSKNKKGRAKILEMEEPIAPMVCVDKDMFILSDDVLPLLERAASEPLPHQPLPSKDDKAQNRSKDGGSGEEFNKDSIERDERRLTELGRRTMEIFILTHIFSRIEVAYQEAVALKRQEELIREEEAAVHAENELKAKRGASEKEKRAKKKQAKKCGSQKGKDRGRNGKSDSRLLDKHQQNGPSVEKSIGDFSSKEAQLLEKIDALEGVSNVSDTGDEVTDAPQPDLEDRSTSTVNWDTDTSEIHHNMQTDGSRTHDGQIERRSPSIMDDSSSTCSTDSVRSVVMNGPYRGTSVPNSKTRASPKRGKNQQGKEMRERTGSSGNNLPSVTATNADSLCNTARGNQPETRAVVLDLKDQIQWVEQHQVEKEEVITLQKKLNIKDQVDIERPLKLASAEPSSSSANPGKRPPSISQQLRQTSEKSKTSAAATDIAEPVSSVEASSSSPAQTERSLPPITKSPPISSKSEANRPTTPAKSTMGPQVTAVSRPSSAPLIPGRRQTAPIASPVQTMPLLSRSVSAAGRLGSEPSPSAQSYIPQSYRNAIMGKTSMTGSPSAFSHPSLSSSNQVAAYSRSPSVLASSPVLPPHASVRKDQSSARSDLTFGPVTPGRALLSQNQLRDDFSSLLRNSDDVVRLNTNGELQSKHYTCEAPPSSFSRPYGVMSEEFPHLDIINDLLDEEQSIGKAANGYHQQHYHQHHSLSQQYSSPGSVATADMGSSSSSYPLDQAEHYYDEAFPGVYVSSTGHLSGMRDAHPKQVNLPTFGNSQIDCLIQNQWPYSHADISDLSMLTLGSPDTSGYSYQVADYASLACGVNGYNMYRPANGL